ncbi:hypothetical protein [Cellulomonas fengjieae]|uniref:hypothetical protein n=1 Tax=Cellulomonas fengjieae TaxID=2819978 RepID=UPI001AAF39A0|nr:hypothetical protein [Cellulomonas fengjieae]MBO3103500.1 hypothetical protein [Cellulomonas fengjieae]
METLSFILGSGGVVLLLVALVGGGFTFSGSVFPRIGKVARVPCFVMGSAMLLVAIGLVVAVEPLAAASDPEPGPTSGPSEEELVGVLAFDADVLLEPYVDADWVLSAWEGQSFTLTCVVFGEVVVSPGGGYESDLWHYVEGGYVPDAYVLTDVSAQDLPLC